MLASARLRLLFLTAVLVALPACENVSVVEVDVASISVMPGEATLLPSEVTHLSATPRDASGAALADRPLTWRSANPDVASVDASGRVEAHSTGTARIEASSGGVVGTAVVTVNPAPSISLSRSTVEFRGTSGGGWTPPEVIQILNEGGGHLTGLRFEVNYTAGQPGGWLDAVLQGSASPTVLTLRALPGSLAAGTYEAEVQVTSPATNHRPRSIRVTLQVESAPPAIRVSPEALGFSTSEGQGAPPAQSVTVTNSGGGSLTGLSAAVNYASGSASGWLAVELDRTTAPAEVLFSVDPTGLSTGVFEATVQVTSPDASGSPAAVQVRLRFGDPPPQINVIPGSVQISMEEGTTSPRLVPVEITNAGTGRLGGLTAQVQYPGLATEWLQANLRSAVGPTVMDLQFSSNDLEPGTYPAQVQVASPDAINSPTSVDVELVVLTRPVAETSTVTADPDTIDADGASTSAITVTLNDARGDPVPSGGDSVEVSTTAGTLSGISSMGDGRYMATLVSSTTVGTATVTARLRGVQIADSATVHFRPSGPDVDQSIVTADPSTVLADSTSTVTVELRDAQGNPITTSGDDVFLTTDLGELDPAAGTTTDGTFRSAFSSATVGTATITAHLGTSADAPQIGTASVSVQAGPPDPDRSELESGSDEPQMPADGSLTIRVQLRDAEGNNVTQSGDPVFLTTDLGELDPVRGTTTEGRFESLFTSSETGTATISAYLGEDEGGQEIGTLTITVQERTADAESSEITSDRTHISRNGSANIRVQLRDASGDPLTSSGTPIFLTTSRGQVTPASGTSTDGVFESVFTSNQPGNSVITAYLGEDAQGALIGRVEVVVQGTSGDDTSELSVHILGMTRTDL